MSSTASTIWSSDRAWASMRPCAASAASQFDVRSTSPLSPLRLSPDAHVSNSNSSPPGKKLWSMPKNIVETQPQIVSLPTSVKATRHGSGSPRTLSCFTHPSMSGQGTGVRPSRMYRSGIAHRWAQKAGGPCRGLAYPKWTLERCIGGATGAGATPESPVTMAPAPVADVGIVRTPRTTRERCDRLIRGQLRFPLPVGNLRPVSGGLGGIHQWGGRCWRNGGTVHPFDSEHLAAHHRHRLLEVAATARLARRKSSWFRRSVSGLGRLLTRRQPIRPATISQSPQPRLRHIEDAVVPD